MSDLIGKRVTVYDRYLFGVPVVGVITYVAKKDGAYAVTFDESNPGGRNVTKHSGKFFHYQQCRLDGDVVDCEFQPSQRETLKECLELLHAIETIEYHNKDWLATFCNRSPANINKEKRALLERAIRVVGSPSVEVV